MRRCFAQVLVEEAHNFAILVHIWQLILRHADVFYPARALFVSQMVHSLAKLGLQVGRLELRC